MLIKILIALVLIMAVFAIVVAFQPADFRIERSTAVAAPPAAVFALVNDFHRWDAWSPWAKLDPAMKATFEGPLAGPGAIYTWAGNNKVGEGRMTILESRPTELIRIKLEFLKPFKTTNTTEFLLKPAAGQTAVTWSMSGRRDFMTKAVCLFMDMDQLVGGDFEKGLAQMKSLVEAAAKN